jgi:hypothetical protein
MGQWLDSLTGWLSANPQWLGLAIFLVACMECLAIAGIIVPGTVLLFAVAVLAGSGAFSLGETLLLGFLGGLLGDALSYSGQVLPPEHPPPALLRHHPEWIGSAESYFQRYGIASLLVGRFIGPLRPMLPMVAGMFDMPCRASSPSACWRAPAGRSPTCCPAGPPARPCACRCRKASGWTPGSSPAPRGADRPEPEQQPA